MTKKLQKKNNKKIINRNAGKISFFSVTENAGRQNSKNVGNIMMT